MEKTEVVAKIIEYVGGKDNVVNTWHCMTRLRFELKDTSKIQEDAIKALDGVIGVQFAKGQLQIVLGTSVHKYYDIALQMLDLKEDIAAPAQPEKKKDFISWFMDMVSGVFGPIVPAIAGAGMIKGLMGGLVALGVVSNATDTYKIIDMLASGVFTFLPFFIAASAAKNSRPTSIWPLPLPPL
ncbi:PTS transporter subunit EIIB [Faecalibacterium taiwanense]|uniref:PTS transporter subunit EIIB n=1 Tax=Faecalibacterium taiwanense TaxID=3030638 RepID=UPI003AAD290C